MCVFKAHSQDARASISSSLASQLHGSGALALSQPEQNHMLNAYLDIARASFLPASTPQRSMRSSEPVADVLTQREEEVLELMRWGLSNGEIANKLGINLNTVKSHSNNLFAKLGVKNRTQAVVLNLNST